MSDNYRVLTRKYRPRSFDDVVSQDHVISTLRNAIAQNRISHAYLFCGPRGVGKTTMARVVARMINGVGEDIDGEELGRTLDIIEIDAASNSGVDDVRHLRDGVRVPPQNGTYKVYIIDEVHMLSKQAFNALLKTLEEPPDYVKFIFATTEPHKVLPTVLSRCQRFDFRRIKVGEIVDRLRFISEQESIQIDDASLHVIARKADGALRDALSIMDQVIAFCGNEITYERLIDALNVVSQERLYEITDCIIQRDANRVMHIVEKLLLEGHDIQEFLAALAEHFRNLYLAADAAAIGLIEATDEERERMQSVAKNFSRDDMLRMLHLATETQARVRDAHQPRIQLEVAMLKLVSMERAEGLQTLLAEIRDLKKKLHESGNGLSLTESVGESADSAGKNAPQQGVKSGLSESPAEEQEPGPQSESGKITGSEPETTDRHETKSAQPADKQQAKPTESVAPDTAVSPSSPTPQGAKTASDTPMAQGEQGKQGEPATSGKPSPPKTQGAPTTSDSPETSSPTSTPTPTGTGTGTGKKPNLLDNYLGKTAIRKNGASRNGAHHPASQNKSEASEPGASAAKIKDTSGNIGQNQRSGGDDPISERSAQLEVNKAETHSPEVKGSQVKPAEAKGREAKHPKTEPNEVMRSQTGAEESAKPSSPPGNPNKGADQRRVPFDESASEPQPAAPSDQNDVGWVTEQDSETDDPFQEAHPEPERPLYMHEIQQNWSEWIDQVKTDCGNLLGFALNRTKILDFSNNTLEIECQDSLTESMISQNLSALRGCFETVFFRDVLIKTKVRAADPDDDGNDPYSQFRKLQQKEPKMRMLVDMFGVELDH